MTQPHRSAASRKTLVATCAWAALSWTSAAWAIGESAAIDINKFHPAPGTAKLVTLDLAEVGPHMEFVPQLFVHYARRPLTYI